MLANSWTRVAFSVAVAVGTCACWPGAVSSVAGLGQAQAAEFYTRKRVNGRWVTGRFPKETASRRAPPQEVAVASLSSHEAPLPEPRPAELGGAQPTMSAPYEVAAPDAAEAERRVQLQRALELRAQQIASKPPAPAIVDPAAEGPGRAKPEPLSVSFDFASGQKTTIYPGDIVVREPFDPSALKSLASPPPAGAVQIKTSASQ